MLSPVAKKSITASGPKREIASDDFLRAVVDVCVSNVAVLDEFGAILHSNKAWRLFEGATSGGSEGQQVAFENYLRVSESQFHEDAETTLADDIQQILSGEEKEFHRKYYGNSQARQRPFLMHAARLNLPGSTFRVLLTHENTRVAPANLPKQPFAQLLDTAKILAWESDTQLQRFTYVSEQATSMLGYPASAWYEPNFLATHIYAEDRKRALATLRKQALVPGYFDMTFRIVAADGRIVWVQNLVSVSYEDDALGRMHGFMIDISERKRAEKALEDLGARLIAAQEEERKRVARELHDDLNQRMAVLSIELEQLSEAVGKPVRIKKRIQGLQRQVREISTDIHRLSYKLHPSKLEHLGLAAAVKSLCDELSQNAKPKIYFSQSGLPAELPKEVTLCIFRIAQEALRNCVKHSGAQSARVQLRKTADAICLSVSDNGCGFDTKSEVMEKGLGFISMKERLRIVGGRISIYSYPPRGTRIEVLVPLTRVDSRQSYQNANAPSVASVA